MRLPSLFVSHGAPTVALHEEDPYAQSLERFGASLAKDLRAIVCVSAHWFRPGPVQISSAARPGIVHDFGGFQEELYTLDYPAPGDPALAERVASLLQANKISTHLQ